MHKDAENSFCNNTNKESGTQVALWLGVLSHKIEGSGLNSLQSYLRKSFLVRVWVLMGVIRFFIYIEIFYIVVI